jgi:DNA helicase HerA-like ATPase
MTAYQIADDRSSDREAASFVAYTQADRLQADQFVIIECPSGRQCLGMVSGPGLNLGRDALEPLDNTSLNQIERYAQGKVRRDVVIRELWLFRIRLLKDITVNVESVLVRPLTGAVARPAAAEEIIRALGLPPISSDELMIGTIINSPVPICVTRYILAHHIMVAGTTGSGKTNSIANIAKASEADGGCNIIWDHKPDYQHAHLPSDDAGAGCPARELSDVVYYAIGRPNGINPAEQQISVRSSDLDPEMLAAALFYRDDEGLAREGAELALEWFYGEIPHGTVYEFRDWLLTNKARFKDRIHGQTLDAIIRKSGQPSRIPSWVDAGARSGNSGMWSNPGTSSTTPLFEFDQLIAPRRTIVVRIGSDLGGGRYYALLLSYVLKRTYALKESRAIRFPINHFVDEAQDIFSAGRQFRTVAVHMLDQNVRKGRSQGIGFVFGVQAADQVPETILNLLNTRIIHRHNSHEQIRVAANMATEEQRRTINTLGTGEAFVCMHGSNSLVRARMLRSPFKLTRHDQ